MLKIKENALTFDDILLVPAYSDILPRDVDNSTRLTRGIKLNIPLISAAMDTVTEAPMAIALAQAGGLGIIHKSMSIDQQANQVRIVKKFESGVVKNPITIEASASIQELLDIKKAHNISGVPVIDKGALTGIVTSRDVRFASDPNIEVREVMTPKDRLITVPEGVDTSAIKDLFHRHRIEKILMVNSQFDLIGLVTVKDIEKSEQFPMSVKDEQGRLLSGASVSIGDDSLERVQALVEAEVDVLVVDTSHGHSKNVLKLIKAIKEGHPDLQLIGGNIATAEAAVFLKEAGVDAVKVGIGPGSICTTRIVAGVGVPQVTAIANVATALKGSSIPVIADGGIRYSGDLAKALAAGASSAMLGNLFAGTEEAPGYLEMYQGRSYKTYRGMGSIAAMSKLAHSGDRYLQGGASVEKLVPEGIEGRVPYKGPVATVIYQIVGGLSASMGYTGCASIASLHEKAHFVTVSNAGMNESHTHNVAITKEPPNYPGDL